MAEPADDNPHERRNILRGLEVDDLKSALQKIDRYELWHVDPDMCRLIELLGAKILELEKRIDAIDEQTLELRR